MDHVKEERMADQKQPQENLAEHRSQQELLLEKIQIMLDKTDPERWRKGGKPLDRDERFEKALNAWHEVYTIDLQTGTLVVRKETPVKGDFLGRGFILVPIAPPNHIVELRPSGWHHAELTDYNRRSRFPNRERTLLAEGDLGVTIHKQVQERYNAHFAKKQSEYDNDAYEYVSRLPGRLRDETLNVWERIEDNPGEVRFIASLDDRRIDVMRAFLNNRESFELTVTRHGVESVLKDNGLARDLFESIQELGQTSRLMTLTKVLEQI